MENGRLAGKKALVLGVANKMSLAWAIAKALYHHGAEIFLSCAENNKRRVEKLAPEIQARGVAVCDVRRDEEIEGLFAQVEACYEGKLDVLVHSLAYADMNYLGGPYFQVTRPAWHEALDISAYSLTACVRRAYPLFRKAGGGSVVTLSYAGAREVVPGYNIMGVAKAALEASVRYLAYDLGPDNIRVNAVSPSAVRTISALAIEDFETALKVTEEHSPMLRNVTADEVARAVVFLASDESSAITGHVLPVDVGLHMLSRPSIKRKIRDLGRL
ncbi:enoyl-ACP reductase FabI [Desulfosoma sp.]